MKIGLCCNIIYILEYLLPIFSLNKTLGEISIIKLGDSLGYLREKVSEKIMK